MNSNSSSESVLMAAEACWEADRETGWERCKDGEDGRCGASVFLEVSNCLDSFGSLGESWFVFLILLILPVVPCGGLSSRTESSES